MTNGTFRIINTDPELVLDGDLKKALLKGAKIVWYNCDGWDWHVIAEMPKGVLLDDDDEDQKYWRFLFFETTREFTTEAFSLMVSSNQTRIQFIKDRRKEYNEDRFHKGRIATADPKSWYAVDKQERLTKAKKNGK